MKKNPVILCILDGFGMGKSDSQNAIHMALMPTFNKLHKLYAHTTLRTDGKYVGLPKGQVGNSKVGHMTIGSGQCILQDLTRINHAIKSRSYTKTSQWKQLLNSTKSNSKAQHPIQIHIMGLLSLGNVHGSLQHVIDLVKELNMHNVCPTIHFITDGRDTLPKTALSFLDIWDKNKLFYKAGTLSGRYFAMDRNKNYARTNLYFNALIADSRVSHVKSFKDAIVQAYQQNQTDEFIKPVIINGFNGIHEQDKMLSTFFRADRARQILRALLMKDFKDFSRNLNFSALQHVLSFISISNLLDPLMQILFPTEKIKNTLSIWLAKYNKTQLHIAETEKYAHVTYFFSGGMENPVTLEDRVIIPSNTVTTFDKSPAMRAKQITDYTIKNLHKYDFIVMNYANADMVGHTGNFKATKTTLELLDQQLERLYHAIKDTQSLLIITADHGNAECMFDQKSQMPHTSHTLNPVPFIIIPFKNKDYKLLKTGSLQDIAPTLLKLMNLPIPKEMTGHSLL